MAVSHLNSRPDRDTMIRRLRDFQVHWLEELEEWKQQGLTGEEQQSAQRFWIDLFRCFGIRSERVNLFERNVKRSSTGGRGRIDLFYPGVVIGEAKRPGVDLAVAYDQVLDYLNGGDVLNTEWPRYILLTNFETFRLIRLGDAELAFDTEFPLTELASNVDSLKFLAGYQTVSKAEQAEASILASKLMADLFTSMVGDDVDEGVADETTIEMKDEDLAVQETSMYLTRILFLLFGDDSGLWERDLFTRFVEESTTPETLGSQLNALFDVLNTPENRRARVPESMARFPYVNGDLFAENMRTKYFDAGMRNALLRACRFDWSNISPAIFGSLFQLVKSKEARRADGEHYTSETNILKTIGPLFLDELRAEADRLIRNKSTRVSELAAFRDSLADNVYCDPACGSGNFLIVAYRELRRIETDIIVEIRRRSGDIQFVVDVALEQKLSISQFYGIELGWWPARIAEIAMFLVDHQANQELVDRVGQAPARLPIKVAAHIRHANALQTDWRLFLPLPKGKTYIFGNPPFIGQYTKTKEQTEDMKRVWGKDYDGYLDYVTGWHAQAMHLFEDQRPGEFAFVTTNSITQGQPVPGLFGPLYREGWLIKFAHRTFAWDSEAPGKAAVHCVIVGFTRSQDIKPRLWDYKRVNGDPEPVKVETGINAYLIDAPNVLIRKRSKPLSTVVLPATRGSQPTDGGNLIVEVDEYEEVLKDPVASKYLRPFRMGRELVRGLDRWCLWMADDDFDPTDLNKSEILRERVQAVRDMRLASRKKATQESANTPYLFQENRQPNVDYVAIPRVVSVSRHFYTVAHLHPDVIAGDKVYTAADPEGLLFGLISSSMFITWQRAVGGRLKSDLSFSNTLVWNTFPVPELTEEQRQRIIDAGKRVLEARALHPERSLADHYNPLAMDPALLDAHKILDREVDKAFGASKRLQNERQRQELLFSNYARLVEEEK
ncbi:DNA methyltransferase [Corynebacterium coyleae]|uniref:DNA methyltransferase n=1 Tax=Corynebacterium coyleae TaxID=53374 RepID=UPI00254DBC3B|nr:DNA methyltransferase [Corynebacterium coyleae]MDK8798588.1 N-6 DNA methylase [Corynebacterium coyleae]